MNPATRRMLALAATVAVLALAFHLTTAHLWTPWAVVGHSMAPTLLPGDRLLVDRTAYRGRLPLPGEIVLVRGRDGASRPFVKRVRPLPPGWNEDPERPRIWVEGDNATGSLDSRTFGPLPADRVVGRAFWRYWPPSRLGTVR